MYKRQAVQQQQAVAQSRNLNAELQILAKFGGFNVLESSVDGIQNMNPERKARRNIFLSDPERAAERKELEKRLEMWVDMLKGDVYKRQLQGLVLSDDASPQIVFHIEMCIRDRCTDRRDS